MTIFAKSDPVSNQDQVAVILQKAPSKYSSVLTNKFDEKGTNCTVIDLQKAMKQQYDIEKLKLGGDNTDHEDADEGEIALIVADRKKKNLCYLCGSSKHKANDCPLKTVLEVESNARENSKSKGKGKGNKSNKFNGKCNLCGMKGNKEGRMLVNVRRTGNQS